MISMICSQKLQKLALAMQLQLQDGLLGGKKTEKIIVRKQSALLREHADSSAITDRQAALFTTFS